MLELKDFEDRKKSLEASKKSKLDLVAALDQTKIKTVDDLNAVDGAIQDCAFWISKLQGQEDQTKNENNKESV